MDVFKLSRDWFDWCFENPEKVKPNHTALYFFCIEHCNRLGWKEKFGLPSEMAKDAIGIKNYRTYSKTFENLIEWGFIKLIQKSKNQYSANVIAIAENTKANTKALSKATQKHVQKQRKSIVCIDIPETLLPETTLETKIFNGFLLWAEENCPQVLKMKNPFTQNEFSKLKKDYSNEQIKSMLLKMQNWEPLLKKNSTANLTFRNWAEKEKLEKLGSKTTTIMRTTSPYWDLLKPEYR